MKDLPKSTKILISLIIVTTLTLGVSMIVNSSFLRDKKAITTLTELHVKNPEQVLKEYKSYDSKKEADAYLKLVVEEAGDALSKKEEKLFGDKLVTNYKNVFDTQYKETFLYLTYNKYADDSDSDFQIIESYLKNPDAYDVKVIYTSNKSSQEFGKFLFFDLYSIYLEENEKPSKDVVLDKNDNKINYGEELPKAFLVEDGSLKKIYHNMKDIELKGSDS